MPGAIRQVVVAWEEHIICCEKGNRLVHFYLKNSSGDSNLAIVGTERNIRHMIYILSDEFLQVYGSQQSVLSIRKWRARRDVVDWLTSLVSKDTSPLLTMSSQDLGQPLGFGKPPKSGFTGGATCCQSQMVRSFAVIMAEDENHYLGYLEDMYENNKEQKKVKVRWFNRGQEVKEIIANLVLHPAEVFSTPHVQVISAQCIVGPAAVLTPMHYEKCVAAVPQSMSSELYLCSRQLKNNRIKPFSLSKLSGYSDQSFLSFLDTERHDSKMISHKVYQVLQNDNSGVLSAVNGNKLTKCEPTNKKLRIKLSNKRATGIELVECEPGHMACFGIGEKIELLCQDSGVRGCWFRCKVLQVASNYLLVQYHDVEDADGFGKLEEWVLSSRMAVLDKLGTRSTRCLTVRPCPFEQLSDSSLEVGAAVDVWWCDGWWEGVVIGGKNVASDNVQVYFPGENRFLTIQWKNVRTSRDWVDNRW